MRRSPGPDSSFAAAFESGDAKAVAAHWTENGEYISDDGTVIRGRANIEKEYAGLFARKKGAKVEIDLESIRFPSRDTAIEEGHFKVRYGKDQAAFSKYSVLHVRENGKWLMAVVREWPGEGVSLRELDWLVGTWTAKRDDTEIMTTYKWWGEKSFLRMDITVKDKEQTSSGFQMIGKDASTGQIRSWTFDTDGSFGEATWEREGKKWIVRRRGCHGQRRRAVGDQYLYPPGRQHLHLPVRTPHRRRRGCPRHRPRSCDPRQGKVVKSKKTAQRTDDLTRSQTHLVQT